MRLSKSTLHALLVGLCVISAACGTSDEQDIATTSHAPVAQPPLPNLPIRLPDGARLTDEFNPVPGTPSFHVQLRLPGGVEEAAQFFTAEIARLGMKEIEMPNPRQSTGLVARLAGESKKARVVIMIVKHPIEKGSDADIRWEEPPI